MSIIRSSDNYVENNFEMFVYFFAVGDSNKRNLFFLIAYRICITLEKL